jgi:hypothetical protein
MPVAQEFDRVNVAVFGVEGTALDVFRDCFKDFRVAVQLSPLDPQQIGKGTMDACILRLDAPETPELLANIRRSDLQKRCVVYGVGTQEAAIRLAREGVNALIEKLTAREILSAIRVTYLLLVHRLRRHVRIPLVLQVEVEAEDQTVHGITRDISAGGLNITADEGLALGRKVKTRFDLPQGPQLELDGVVCWSGGTSFGVALFNSSKQARLRKWTEDYLLVEEPPTSPPQP